METIHLSYTVIPAEEKILSVCDEVDASFKFQHKRKKNGVHPRLNVNVR